MPIPNTTYSIENCKSLIFGLFNRSKQSTKILAFEIVKVLFQNSTPLSNSDLSKILNKKISYPIITKLEKNKIIIKTEGSKHKMLVDNGISDKPAYGKIAIQEMKILNFQNLLNDSENRPEIKNIITEVFEEKQVTNRPLELFEFIKIYNKIIDKITKENLYNIESGYGKLEWRPQKTNKYKLNHDFLKMFIKDKRISLMKAVEKVK